MSKSKAISYALLAAAFYAINVPVSKLLLRQVAPTTMAALLYLGAGIGMSVLSFFDRSNKSEKLDKSDLPYTIGMIILDIAAPVFLMLGISYGTSANASLLGNFEIVATALIALFVFKESVSKRLWGAIILITLSSLLLSFEGTGSFSFSRGALFVILATLCWGMENNCTRSIASKDTYQIVVLKGIFSGLGALGIAFIRHESIPEPKYIAAALILGFVAYGLSIFFYVRAQNVIGAAKTSAYYAASPFIGVFLSFAFLHEKLHITYTIAFLIMITGAIIAATDTLVRSHEHAHRHTYTHFHNGHLHTHTITHTHSHEHYTVDIWHWHRHSLSELEQSHIAHT